jgi:Bacterial tandem repeat domain 1
MPAKKPPETWFWSHDIKPTQIDSVVTPGSRLVRLSSYGEGAARRFAALVYQEHGSERSYALDLDGAALAARLRETGARPVAITAAADARFSVVLETGPGPLASAHVDLDEAGLRALIDDQHAIADVATYVAGGVRKYAAIVEERAATSWLFVGVSAPELDAQLLEHEAGLTRLRAYRDGGTPRFAAIAERGRPAGWAWYADLDGDGVAKQLETNAAYPVDLDATRGDRGARFTVVMVRER